MRDSSRLYDERTGFEKLAAPFLGYLRSRTAEHWLMFAAGVVIGLFVG